MQPDGCQRYPSPPVSFDKDAVFIGIETGGAIKYLQPLDLVVEISQERTYADCHPCDSDGAAKVSWICKRPGRNAQPSFISLWTDDGLLAANVGQGFFAFGRRG